MLPPQKRPHKATFFVLDNPKIIQSSTCRILPGRLDGCACRAHTKPDLYQSATKKGPPKRPSFDTDLIRRLNAVVHVELFRVSRVLNAVYIFHFQVNVSFDHVFSEHVALSQEV